MGGAGEKGGSRVSEFFAIKSKTKKKLFFWGGGRGEGIGWGEGARVIDFFK